ncbi:MAG TPA: peptidyl-prolyl cis-trans isomerase [Candidatus Eisenbacteria bacterium]|nr:peptidyl-prolyl cis-trans isomerase [Candidatus Eisenbacteria bacterium]
MRPFAIALVALGFLVWKPADRALASQARSPLPDTVLAQVGSRQVTRSEFLRQWERLGATEAPADRPLRERHRVFLNQLIDKELLTQAAATETYAPTPEEEAKLGLLQLNLMRQAYYRREVLDSLPPEGGAPAETHAHAAHGADMDRAAQVQAAELRLIERLTAPLAPQWGETVAAFLARAFQKLPRPKEEGPGWMRWNYTAWMPPVALADTGRVLGRSTLGPFTIGRFLWHWAQVPPEQRDRPDTASAVIDWARNFLAQGIMDNEARRLGLARDPEVAAEVAKQRQIMALDAYYRAHVSTAVDTSETRLRALYAKNPHAYDSPPFSKFLAVWFRRFDDAAAARAALEKGARWDSLLAARFPMPQDPSEAQLAKSEADLYRYPQAQLATSPDTTLTAWFASAKPNQVFGPRNRAGQWWVYRFLEHDDGKARSFAQARPLVAEKAAYDDEEKALRTHLDTLRTRYAVRVNDAALAALPANGGQ